MEISDIKNLADLARLKLSPKEQEKLLSEMGSILEYVGQIKEVAGGKDGPQSSLLRNVMREDGEPHESGTFSEKLIGGAPKSEKGYINVKNIL